MKVLLTHTYFIEDDPKEKLIMKPYPPLGILYLSAFLEKEGVDNIVFDSTFSNKEIQWQKIQDYKPEVVAIYCNLMTKPEVVNLVKRIKENNNLNQIKVVLGGPDVTYNLENYLATGADAIVIGEGEQSLHELVKFWEANPSSMPINIPGIAFLDGEQKLQKNPPRIKIKEVDELPFPNRKAIELNLYLNKWKEKHGENSITVSTQRGCPYTCKWCSTAVYGQSYRRRSPQNVVDELKEIYQNYTPDAIWFVDDVFTVSHKWLKSFAECLEENKLQIKFECISRADRMNSEVIQLLKRAGCFRVWIGAESGSQKIIDAMDRRVDTNKVRQMIIEAQENGIEAGTFIMLGYPGETLEDIEETVYHLKTSNPKYFTITIAYPIKGTTLYDEIEAKQTKSIDWFTQTDRERDFKRTYSTKFYDFAVRYVINEVNFEKSKNTQGFLNVNTLKFSIKSKMAKMAMLISK